MNTSWKGDKYMDTSWLGDEYYGYRHRHWSEVCSNGQLVYVRTLKCASTFFYRNLIDEFEWKEIKFSDIDWEHQHVFSHMLDPVKRRHKGIAEFLSMIGADKLLEFPEFKQFISHVPFADMHTVGYSDSYGEYAQLIDWIPLNGSHQQVVNLTSKLLNTYSIETDNKWNFHQAHYGDSKKLQLATDLKTLWESSNLPDSIRLCLDRDIDLYNQVIKKFNPDGDSWKEISWLKDK